MLPDLIINGAVTVIGSLLLVAVAIACMLGFSMGMNLYTTDIIIIHTLYFFGCSISIGVYIEFDQNCHTASKMIEKQNDYTFSLIITF